MQEIRYIDLFGGVGGFRLGIERANHRTLKDNPTIRKVGKWFQEERNIHNRSKCGERPNSSFAFKCVAYYEIDKHAVQVYNRNFGESHHPTDIREVKTDDIPDHDLICAGFPCQSFSIAGKRKGFQDTRGTLFYEIVRIAEAKRPRWLLLENVKGLLSHDEGRTFEIIIESLAELGYGVEWEVLNSKNFGVPQNRERVFIVGHLGGFGGREVFPVGQAGEVDKKKEYKKQRGRKTIWSEDYTPTIDARCGALRHSGEPYIQNIPHGYNTGFKKEFPSLGADKGSAYNELLQTNSRIRRLTPTECERLQSFPDGWTSSVSDTQRYKQMGNAVTVNVVEAIVEKFMGVMY